MKQNKARQNNNNEAAFRNKRLTNMFSREKLGLENGPGSARKANPMTWMASST